MLWLEINPHLTCNQSQAAVPKIATYVRPCMPLSSQV